MNRAIALGLAGLGLLSGVVLLLAGFCTGLTPWVGRALALALTGMVLVIPSLLLLAWPKRRVPAEPARQDPLLNLVFDLSFAAGRSLRRRRT